MSSYAGVEIEATAVEEDREFEALPIAKAAGGVPDPLDLRVQTFGDGVRDDASLAEGERRGSVSRSVIGGRVAVATSVRAREVLALIQRTLFAKWLPQGAFAQEADDAARWRASSASAHDGGSASP